MLALMLHTLDKVLVSDDKLCEHLISVMYHFLANVQFCARNDKIKMLKLLVSADHGYLAHTIFMMEDSPLLFIELFEYNFVNYCKEILVVKVQPFVRINKN